MNFKPGDKVRIRHHIHEMGKLTELNSEGVLVDSILDGAYWRVDIGWLRLTIATGEIEHAESSGDVEVQAGQAALGQ